MNIPETGRPCLIRPARPEEMPGLLPALAEVEKAAASIFPPGSIPEYIRDDNCPPELLLEGAQNGSLWLAFPEGAEQTPVGFALLCMFEDLALLAQMDVHPDYARQGLGRRMLAEAVRAASRAGFAAMYLTTFARVPWNAPYYARLGFQALQAGEQPPRIREILADEAAAGLKDRLAMRMAL